jgi:hypothetical protein
MEGRSEGLAQEVAVLGNTELIVEPGSIRPHWAGRLMKQSRWELSNAAYTAAAHRR